MPVMPLPDGSQGQQNQFNSIRGFGELLMVEVKKKKPMIEEIRSE